MTEQKMGSQQQRPSRPLRRKRRWGWLVLVVAALGVSGFVMSRRSAVATDASGKPGTFAVRTDDLTITVTESGFIKAQQSTDVICEVEGRGMEIIQIVPEGTVITLQDVEDGKIVCELNASDLQDNLNQEQVVFSTAKASYTEAQEGLLIQRKQNESDLAAAELAVQFGQMDLRKHLGEAVAHELVEGVDRDPNAPIDVAALLSLLEDPASEGGAAKQKLKELEDAIVLAKAKLTQADQELTSSKKLRDANYAPEIEVRQKELAVQSFKIQSEQAADTLDLYKRYDFPKETRKFLSDYREAQRELDRTHARNRSRLAQAQAKLESARASYELHEARVAKLQRQIGGCIMRAPSPGIVIYGTSADWRQRREDPVEVGDMVHKGQKILTIPNSGLMGVELAVHESSVDKVKVGQQAKVTVEAFPDRAFPGKVSRVAPLPDPQQGWLDPGVKVYTTHVLIDGSHDFIKPGMSAKVEILIEELHDTMIVPVQVVANRDGKKVCYVFTPDGPKPRVVETGAFNDVFVQILSGLEVGEEVLLSPPRLLSTTASVKSDGAGK
jgi:RND family efflux transporter MFP subunit